MSSPYPHSHPQPEFQQPGPQQPYGQHPYAQQPPRPLPGSAAAGVPLRGPHPAGACSPGSAGYWRADANERQTAMLTHLGAVLAGFIVPLIMFVMKKDESPFVREHARHSLNAQISYTIYIVGSVIVLSVVAFVLAFFTFGLSIFLIYLAFIPGIMLLVFDIIACVRGNSGEGYAFPFVIDMVK